MICPYCGSLVSLRPAFVVYKREGFGDLFICDNYPICDTYVGARNGKPLGTLANRELRDWRKAAHQVFDSLWKSGKMTRSEAYFQMQLLMNLSEEEAHIAKFDIEQCKRLIDLIARQPIEIGGQEEESLL